MRELALFAGAGGGLLATKHLLGWQAVCYVEHNPYRVEVLKARIRDGLLDDAPIWDDARTFDGWPWCGCVDIVTAGFPCQPFSQAGKRQGQDDERNMWPDTIRIIREVRPRFALLENVSGLLTSGYFGTILGDLAESGYDARWRMLSAAELGAPHQRKRLWIAAVRGGDVADTEDVGWGDGDTKHNGPAIAQSNSLGHGSALLAHTNSPRQSQQARLESCERGRIGDGGQAMAHTASSRLERDQPTVPKREQDRLLAECNRWWEVEPELGRVVDGLPNRVERLKALGDAQVPAVAAAVWEMLTGGVTDGNL